MVCKHTLRLVPRHDKLMSLCIVPVTSEVFPPRGLEHSVQGLSMGNIHVGGPLLPSGDATTVHTIRPPFLGLLKGAEVLTYVRRMPYATRKRRHSSLIVRGEGGISIHLRSLQVRYYEQTFVYTFRCSGSELTGDISVPVDHRPKYVEYVGFDPFQGFRRRRHCLRFRGERWDVRWQGKAGVC